MKNKSLSEKRKEDGYWGYIYMEQHVKEKLKDFVEELKGNIDSNHGIHKMCAIQAKKEINKVFDKHLGKELIN